MSSLTIPQPIESYLGFTTPLSQPQSPLIPQPSPIEYTHSNYTQHSSYSYTECLCESCQYYRSSAYTMSMPSTPTTPLTPMTPNTPYSAYANYNMPYPTQHTSAYPSYDQSSAMSMPLQTLSQNTYYNQMPTQHGMQGMCYPGDSSAMMMNTASCYPTSQPTTPLSVAPSSSAAPSLMDPEAINHPVAYSLTEQFRHIVGAVVTTACTPRGRSLLQSVMRLQHSDKVQTIFEEIVAEAGSVMLDPNGCHVVRSLVEMLDEEQVRKLVAAMSETTVLNVATTSQYTRRILQALFERHKADSLSAIVDVLSRHALSLATTQQGCIALMRVIERCSPEQKEKLLAALHSSLLDLATDPFGNYVVQSVLEHYRNESVTAVLKGHLLKLAMNKFASNVMEKAFRFSSPAVRAELISELFDDADTLATLVQDGFGNFVIQSVIDSCPTQAEFKGLSDKLRPLLHASPYGHKIETKMRNKKFNANGLSVASRPPALAKEDSENIMPLM